MISVILCDYTDYYGIYTVCWKLAVAYVKVAIAQYRNTQSQVEVLLPKY